MGLGRILVEVCHALSVKPICSSLEVQPSQIIDCRHLYCAYKGFELIDIWHQAAVAERS